MIERNGKTLYLSDLVILWNEDDSPMLEDGETVLATVIAKYEEEEQVVVVTLGDEAKTLILTPNRVEQLESPIGTFHKVTTPEAFTEILANAEARLAEVTATRKGKGTPRAKRKATQGTGNLDI